MTGNIFNVFGWVLKVWFCQAERCLLLAATFGLIKGKLSSQLGEVFIDIKHGIQGLKSVFFISEL